MLATFAVLSLSCFFTFVYAAILNQVLVISATDSHPDADADQHKNLPAHPSL